ncbi:hypothetical protein, partial [Pseudorhodobacter sp.]|uniref:hypothetical protein n=1 Tax=Pseudorhodobacter sp. TaxID=1934400 RepID=UPI00264A2084
MLKVENITPKSTTPVAGGSGDKPKGKLASVADGDTATATDSKPAGDTGTADTPEDADTAPEVKPTDSRMFLSEVIGRGSEVGVGANINRINLDLDANVAIADANIEPERYYPNTTGGFDELDKDSKIYVTARNAGDLIFGAGAPGVSTGGEKGGWGGALSLVTVTPSASTHVSDPALLSDYTYLQLHGSEQTSENDLLLVNVARSHVQNDGAGSGLAAGIAITTFQADTLLGNDAYAMRGDKGTILRATDKSDIVTLAGSGIKGAKTGLSLGVAINLLTRNTAAIIGTQGWTLHDDLTIRAETLGAALVAGTASTKDQAPEDPDAPAGDDAAETGVNDGSKGAPVEVAASLMGDKADDVATAAGNGDDGNGSASGDDQTLAFSGDFAATFSDVNTTVTLHDTRIGSYFEGDLNILATTNVQYGQASAVTAVAVDGVGITGSFGLSDVKHVTDVVIADSAVQFYEDNAGDAQGETRIAATDNSSFDTIVTGRAGHAQDAWGVAISANFNRFRSSAHTTITDSSITNGSYSNFGGDGAGCVDGVCSTNTEGRNTTITADAKPKSTVYVLAARDAVGAETSGGQQMKSIGDTMESAALQAEKPKEDGTSNPDKPRGEGREGLSVAVAPSVVNAAAETRITDSVIIADRNAAAVGADTDASSGKLSVEANALTDVNIDASAGNIGLSFALTKTIAHVELSSAILNARGNGVVAIRSTAAEVQDVSARVGDDSRFKIAGLLSLRELRNRVIVDGDAGSASKIQGGSAVSVEADSTHDLQFKAIAEDSTRLTFAGAGIVSLGQSDTATYFGGKGVTDDGALTVAASDTVSRYTAQAAAVTGKFTTDALKAAVAGDAAPNAKSKVKTPTKGGTTGTDKPTLTDSLAAIADNESEQVAGSTPATPGTGDSEGDDDHKAKKAGSFVIAVNADRRDSAVRTLVGGAYGDGALGRSFDLSGAVLASKTTSIAALNAQNDYKKFTATKAGTLDTTSIGFVGTIAYGHAALTTQALIAAHADVQGDTLNLTATTKLPEPDIAKLDTAVKETRDAMVEVKNATGLLADDLMPDPALEIARKDINVLTRTEGAAGVGFAIDVGIHTVKALTEAVIMDGATAPTGDTLNITATASGGLVALRDLPVSEVTTTGKSDETGSDSQSSDEEKTLATKEGELGKIGLGGALQYLRTDADTATRVGNLATALELENLTLLASNDMLSVATAKSFGGANNFAFNAGVGIVDYRGSAEALADVRNEFTISDGTTITASDKSRLFGFGGAGSQSGKVSFGLGWGNVFADRNAYAALTGADRATVVDGRDTGGADSSVLEFGKLVIGADTDGWSAAGAAAGAAGLEKEAADRSGNVGDTPEVPKLSSSNALTETRVAENGDALGEQSTGEVAPKEKVQDKAFGFALAADFAGVMGHNSAVAVLATDGDVAADEIGIEAENRADAVLASGAAVGTGGSFGVAGSVSISAIRTDALALNLGGSRAVDDGKLELEAKDEGTVAAASAGRGGGGTDFAIVGSAALNLGRTTAEAANSDSDISGADAAKITAGSEGAVVAVAGSLAAEVAKQARKAKLGDGEGETTLVLGDLASGVLGGSGGAAGGGAGGDLTRDGAATDPEQDDDEKNSVGIGIVFAANLRPETTRATAVGSEIEAKDIALTASTARKTVSVAAATGAAPDIAISASVAINVINQHVLAELDGSNSHDLSATNSVTLSALDDADATAQVGFLGGGGTFGLGLTVAAQTDTRSTQAYLRDTSFAATGMPGPDVTVKAKATGKSVLQLSSGLASGNADEADDDDDTTNIAVNLPVTYLRTNWSTVAQLSGIAADGLGALNVFADEKAKVLNAHRAITASGDHQGMAGTAIIDYSADQRALVSDSDITAGAVALRATAASKLKAIALRDGVAENNVDIMVVTLDSNGETSARLEESDLDASGVSITARDSSQHDLLANGAVETSGFGATGGLIVDLLHRDVLAQTIGGSVITRAGSDLTLTATSEIKSAAVVLGLASGGDDVAGQANMVWTNDARDVRAEAMDTELTIGRDAKLLALRGDQFLGVQGSTTLASSGLGIGAGVFKFHGLTTARITGDAAVSTANDLTLRATSRTKVLELGIGVTSGGSFSAVGSFGYVDFGQRSNALPNVTGEDRGKLLRDVVEDTLNSAVNW